MLQPAVCLCERDPFERTQIPRLSSFICAHPCALPSAPLPDTHFGRGLFLEICCSPHRLCTLLLPLIGCCPVT
ncbi:hypothetical protein SKAU_G00285290 [Synaphobranchus kaupii]|uniref:Uncharacterized protein n=1 Tax=Synaphobranchus kaupii TaxID=118154 RepID=A0A9Q1EY41_SYNKA|nr:hypothetical protein SKAU_G00285290 [Synaphobranchus kaupii]